MGICGYLHPFDWYGLNQEDRRALVLGLHRHGLTQELLEDLYVYSSFCYYYFDRYYAKGDVYGDAFVTWANLSGIDKRGYKGL